MPNICETCGKPFTNKKHPHQRFCSHPCSVQRLVNQIQQTCVVCGKEFSRQAAKISPYCSAKCSYQALRKDVVESFWAKVDKTSDCWLWTGGKAHFGHGLFKMGKEGRTIGAHRFSYEQTYGTIPDGLIVCHHCDTPACVRPDHLFLGTHADNAQDRNAKDRQAKGETASKAKLTEADVLAIRSAPSGWGENKILAKRYGITSDAISRIRRGKSWKHV